MNTGWTTRAQGLRKYLTVASLGWQDSLVYRFNALVWAMYAVVPSFTLMLVWLAVYKESSQQAIGGLDLRGMMTYYLFVTLLSIAITPNPEWDIAASIRDGKITPFLVRPISYFYYRMTWETSYQVVKTAMSLPAFVLLGWVFRYYIALPEVGGTRIPFLCLSILLAYLLISQLKFLLAITAFWVAEPGGFFEVVNVIQSLFAGRVMPLALLPAGLQLIGNILPFSLLYALPMDILLHSPSLESILWGLGRQAAWVLALSILIRVVWRRGLSAYEANGG